MPGKCLSLVCCWGPAAFHFPAWIFCESFGGGYVCTFFKFCVYRKAGLIFKPDTIIINHQLELSGTRVKYLDHEKTAYKHEIWSYRISEKASNNRSFWRVQSEYMSKSCSESSSICILGYARSESPGEVMRTYRLVRAFATRRCNNHRFVC